MRLQRKFVTLVLLLTIGASSAASFECAKATKRAEILVCSEPKLSTLDEELNLRYKSALARTANSHVVKNEQRVWLHRLRRDCDECNAEGVEEELSDRIAALNDIAGPEDSTSPWTGEWVIYWRGKKYYESAHISIIGLRGGRIKLSGEAYWYPPNRDYGPNVGDLEGVANVKNGVAKFDFNGCKGEIRLKGKTIHVSKEEGCGGFNVSFNGEYRRR